METITSCCRPHYNDSNYMQKKLKKIQNDLDNIKKTTLNYSGYDLD